MAQRQDLINNALQKLKNTAKSLNRSVQDNLQFKPGTSAYSMSQPVRDLAPVAAKFPLYKPAVESGKDLLQKSYQEMLHPSQNIGQFAQKMTMPIVNTAANTYGAAMTSIPTLIASAGFGGGVNALMNRENGKPIENFIQGASKGVESAPRLALLGKFTNPVIEATANSITSQFTNPFIKKAIRAGSTGLMNIPEGYMMKKAITDEPYNLKDAAIDFGSGVMQGLVGAKPGLRVKGTAVYRDDVQHVKEAIDYLTSKGYKTKPQLDILQQLEQDAEIYKSKLKLVDNFEGGRDVKAWKSMSLEDKYKMIANKLQDSFYTPKNQGGAGMTMSLVGDKAKGLNDSVDFTKPLTKSSGDVLKDTEHMIKYNAALQLDRSPEIPKNIKDIIYATDVSQANNPSEMVQLIKKALQGSFTNIPGADNPLLNKSSQDSFIKGLEDDQKQIFKAAPEPPKPKQPVQKDFIDEMETIKKGSNIDKKVNIVDYFRTPDRVLDKIGMKKEANGIRMAYDDYKADLKSEIGRITKWYEQAPSPESSQRIFQYLDGQPVKLEGTDLKIAKEIETYLADWAEKLGLPKDKRIANYITHIFDFDAAQKEFDPEIARLIQDRVPGSVYNPFLEKRLGKLGYKENVWQALDAYVKRATRKVNMDPALANLSKASEGLDIESFNYVKRYGDRINMRPTEMDNLIDNMIKQSPVGYKYGSRPTTVLSSKIRQTVGRATLGFNIGSAVKNLSQGVNTYSKLGEKYTVIGYTKLLGKMASKDLSELYDVGVLDDAVIQDRQLNAVKSVTQKLDSALFAMFDMAEKINRGSAYFGAKSKAIGEGMNEEQAIEYAKKIVRDTQFTFGSVDTPVALSSDIVKTLAQFQTYSLKQTEFLGEMVKEKDIKGLIRYTAASIALYMTVGKALGWNIKDIIPSFRLDSPIVQQAGNIGTLLNPNETGNAKRKALIKQLKLVIPGGTQIGKTIEGFQTADQGYGTNAKGDFLYAVDQSPANKLKASVFGKNSLQETQSYYDSKSKSPLKMMSMTSDMGIPDLVKDFFKPKEKTPYQKAELKKLDEKKAEAQLKTSDKGYVIVNDKLKTLNDTGGTNTLDYGKVATMPESTTMEKIKKQKEAYKIVDKVLNSAIDEGDKEEILMKLGVSRQDAEYYQLAQEPDDVKMGYISDAAGTMKERKDYLTFLAKGRKQINGKMIVSDGVLKDLYDSKVITKDDYDKLKNIVFKDGQPFVKMTGRGKGARIKKIKLGTLSPNLKAVISGGSKSPSIDTSRLKIQQPQMAKIPQIYQMPQNLLS